jgi:hypothetical protein
MRRHFRLVFVTVAVFTVACGMASGCLLLLYGAAIPEGLSNFQQHLSTLFNVGAGAIIGLLGSRAFE